jgi:hypothetical protein
VIFRHGPPGRKKELTDIEDVKPTAIIWVVEPVALEIRNK